MVRDFIAGFFIVVEDQFGVVTSWTSVLTPGGRSSR